MLGEVEADPKVAELTAKYPQCLADNGFDLDFEGYDMNARAVLVFAVREAYTDPATGEPVGADSAELSAAKEQQRRAVEADKVCRSDAHRQALTVVEPALATFVEDNAAALTAADQRWAQALG